jgi:hypothetical protein
MAFHLFGEVYEVLSSSALLLLPLLLSGFIFFSVLLEVYMSKLHEPADCHLKTSCTGCLWFSLDVNKPAKFLVKSRFPPDTCCSTFLIFLFLGIQSPL